MTMPKLKFIEANGEEHIVRAVPGLSVMVAGTSNGVPGLDADCGGACSCATCHVVVEKEWLDRLKPAAQNEIDMLELTAVEGTEGSRLSCQITVTDELDGLTLHIPEEQ